MREELFEGDEEGCAVEVASCLSNHFLISPDHKVREATSTLVGIIMDTAMEGEKEDKSTLELLSFMSLQTSSKA